MNLTFDELERRLYANGELNGFSKLLVAAHDDELDEELRRGYDEGHQEAHNQAYFDGYTDAEDAST